MTLFAPLHIIISRKEVLMKSALQETAEKELAKLETEEAKKSAELEYVQSEIKGIRKYLESVNGQEKKKGRKPSEQKINPQ